MEDGFREMTLNFGGKEIKAKVKITPRATGQDEEVIQNKVITSFSISCSVTPEGIAILNRMAEEKEIDDLCDAVELWLKANQANY